MADIARRRELRRRKILENAELRKQKIFGLCSNNTDLSSNDINSSHNEINSSNFAGDLDETGSTKSLESEVSSKSLNNEASSEYSDDVTKLSEVLRNIPDPMIEHEEYLPSNNSLSDGISDNKDTLENDSLEKLASDRNLNTTTSVNSSPQISTLHSSGGGSLLSNVNDRTFIHTTPNYFWCYLEHPAAPCFLGLIVLLLISLDLGKLVSNGFIIPFCIWELQQIIASYTLFEVREEQPSVIEAALLLCGINKNLITRYIWISKLLKDILEDFSVYIITIVMLQMITGFPPVKTKV